MSRSTLRDMVQAIAQELQAAGIDGAPREARLIAASVCGIDPERVSLEMARPVAPECWEHLSVILPGRLARKPLSHLLGYRDFFKHRFTVTRAVLDPRPETETLVAEALAGPAGRVLDLGTGSGAILLSILAERPAARGLGTDLSAPALAVAEGNAARLGLSGRAAFRQADWWDGIAGRFDLIVSNPPYIAASEMPGLGPELAHEPRMALTDEGDGLSAYRVIAAGARAHLAPGGRLLVEIGPAQGAPVATLFRAAGLEDVAVRPDLDGRDRVVIGTSPPIEA